MIYVIFFVLGFAGGGSTVFVAFLAKRGLLLAQKKKQNVQVQRLSATAHALKERENEFAEAMKVRESEFAQALSARQHQLAELKAKLTAEEKDLEARAVSYTEVLGENAILKRDLRNLDVNLRKLELDRNQQQESQQALDERCKELGARYLKENVKWIGASLTANNFTACKQRLLDVIERCRGIGLSVPESHQAALVVDLKAEFERLVRVALEREEQARIKAQIREEQKLQREIDREMNQLDRERAAIKAALDKALAEARDEHNEEVERLKARLAEAEEKVQRAKSRAQMTKSGYIYIISNVGSFGEGVFKIGMTRRLEPGDRVRELGDASVPFPFDIHMMVSCDDAPKLENALHRALHKTRLNKIKPRKEFFRADIEHIRKIVQENHGEVEYVANAEALQYRQSISMSEDDAQYIEEVYAVEDEEEEPIADDA
ncbi:MAG: GIY-YIG nuclease family protein [Planctomycetota bacterium]|nr:GIY-YIG nuclease family protein [Planctomycetota bacterium]